MKRLIAPLGLALAVASPALAGGLNDPAPMPAPAPVPAPAPMPVSADWTGFYAGGSLGYADVTGSTTLGDDVNGLTFGAHAGYDYDFGSIVLGGELDLSGADITDDVSGLEVDSVARLKLRAGYDAGDFLPYFTAGAAHLTTSGAIDDSDTGYFYGIGGDYRVGGGNMRIGAELLQHRFEDYAGSGIDVDATSLGARVSFEF